MKFNELGNRYQNTFGKAINESKQLKEASIDYGPLHDKNEAQFAHNLVKYMENFPDVIRKMAGLADAGKKLDMRQIMQVADKLKSDIYRDQHLDADSKQTLLRALSSIVEGASWLIFYSQALEQKGEEILDTEI